MSMSCGAEWSIATTLLALAATAAVAAEVDVFLLAGQSNMQGSAKVAELPAEMVRPIAGTFFWTGKTFEPFVVGATRSAKKPGEFGPEVAFALALERGGRPRYLVKYAVGGMPLHHGWDAATWVGGEPAPGRKNFHPGGAADDPAQGTFYRNMLGQFRAALAFLRQRGDVPVVRGLLWMQGEQDSKHEESAAVYARSLRTLRDRVAVDLGLESLPLVFGQVLPHEPPAARFTHRNLVRAQQAAADGRSGKAEAIPGAVMVSTDGIGLLPDTVHYDTQGQLRLGREFARALEGLDRGD
jgi:hypothetical protein